MHFHIFIFSLICSMVLFSPSILFADLQITPAAQLRKLSLRLKGMQPTPEEFDEIAKIQDVPGVQKHLARKADEFLKSDAFYSKFAFRAVEEFSLHSKNALAETQMARLRFFKNRTLESGTIRGFNIGQLIKNGWSWDQILSSDAISNYNESMSRAGGNNLSEKLITELESNSKNKLGLLGTETFLGRFTKTEFSKAAAAYQILFCDIMVPVALGTTTVAKDANAIFNFKSSSNISVPKKESSGSMDHTQPECSGCHNKMDPARDVISGKATYPITFVYTGSNGAPVKFDVPSAKEFLPLVMQQDQFYRCQINRFWTWYMGEDVPLSKNKYNELLQIYKEGRIENQRAFQVPKLIKSIVNSDEFAKIPGETTPYSFVQPILNRCDECHEGKRVFFPLVGGGIPFRVDSWLLTESMVRKGHVSILKNIMIETDFANLGNNAFMPPRDKKPPLSFSEFLLLAKWIRGGARNDDGIPTIGSADAEYILNPIPEAIQSALERKSIVPSNRQVWLRFFENYDILFVFDQIFGLNQFRQEIQAPKSSKALECNLDNLTKAASESTRSLENGKLISETPSTSVSTLIESCTGPFLARAMENFSANKPSIFSYLVNDKKKLSIEKLKTSSWSSLQNPEKRLFIKSMIYGLIGPGVLSLETEEKMVDETLKSIYADTTEPKQMHFMEYTKYIVRSLMFRAAFLSF